MDDCAYFLEQHRSRSRRIRQLAALLVTFCGLMFVDYFAQWDSSEALDAKLPILLYDFSQKYNKPLSEWWRRKRQDSTSAIIRSADPASIPFQNQSAADSEKGVYVMHIPFLAEHVMPSRNRVSGETRRLLGWELPFPQYIDIVLWLPNALLVWILIHLRSLRILRTALRSLLPARVHILVTQSILFDQTAPLSSAKYKAVVVCAAFLFFLLAAGSTAVAIIAPTTWWRLQEGTLYLDPSRIPEITSTRISTAPNELFLFYWMKTTFLSLCLSVLTARELLKDTTTPTDQASR